MASKKKRGGQKQAAKQDTKKTKKKVAAKASAKKKKKKDKEEGHDFKGNDCDDSNPDMIEKSVTPCAPKSGCFLAYLIRMRGQSLRIFDR